MIMSLQHRYSCEWQYKQEACVSSCSLSNISTWILSVYLLLFPKLHLHLLVPRLVLANAVAGDEVAADVSQLWVLLPRLFDETEEET